MTHPTHPIVSAATAAGSGPCGTCGSASVMTWRESIIKFDANGKKDRVPKDLVGLTIHIGGDEVNILAQIRCSFIRSSVAHPRELLACPHWQDANLDKKISNH